MSDSSARSELMKKLDTEGDLAADYLEELLDIADLDGDIEISVEADRAAVAVVTDGPVDRRLKRLVGRDGEVLEALQELTRLAVQAKTGERSRLMLDIGGYRETHRREIAEIARDAITTVLSTGETFALNPMNPFERKVVHDLAAMAGLVSDSRGVGSARHVVISLVTDDDESESVGLDGDHVLENGPIDGEKKSEDRASEDGIEQDIAEDVKQGTVEDQKEEIVDSESLTDSTIQVDEAGLEQSTIVDSHGSENDGGQFDANVHSDGIDEKSDPNGTNLDDSDGSQEESKRDANV